MFHSKLSKKKKIKIDSKVDYQCPDITKDMAFTFKIADLSFNILQIKDNDYDLRYENEPFKYWIQDCSYVKKKEVPVIDDFDKKPELNLYTAQMAYEDNCKHSNAVKKKQHKGNEAGFPDLIDDIDTNANSKALHAFNYNKQILDGLDLFNDNDNDNDIYDYSKHPSSSNGNAYQYKNNTMDQDKNYY